MNEKSFREAWIRIPTEEERLAQLPPGAAASAYDFEFIPAMARLLSSHEKIGPGIGALFRLIMFEPGHLSRKEREMVASVAAAAQSCHY